MGDSDAFDPADEDTVCKICDAEFLEPEDLTLHITQVHSTENSKECQFCSSTFPDLEKYALHLRDVHLSSIRCCRYCTKVFIDSCLLAKHERKHQCRKKNTYSCSQCSRTFINIADLEYHEDIKHNNDTDGIVLKDIHSLLSSVLNIKSPSFLTSLGTSTVYICTKCELTTPNADDYIQHLQVKNCRSLVCDKCSNAYKDRKSLIKHLHSSKACHCYVRKEDSVKQCPKCRKSINKLRYSAHLKFCKPVTCTVCEIIFPSLYELSEHQSEKHPLAITLTTCQFCRREFVGTVALEKHIDRSHKADFHLYKYACVYCEKAYFKHPKDLFGHFYSTHSNLQPYSCRICDKTFKLRKKFTIHIKLEHKSIGFVEFDERYHVFFTDKKPENPFQPTSLLLNENHENENKTDAENQTEAEYVEPTDKETDIENVRKDIERKPLKLRFKKQNRTELNLNSGIMSATETEANQTENETISATSRSKLKRKSKTVNTKPNKIKKGLMTETENEDLKESDDEPLVNVKKRQKMRIKTSWNKKTRVLKSNKKKEFTCKTCDKYCYTYQNYNHHMSLHQKNEVKKCIKCSKEFRSKIALNKHIETKHASSKLTETLKSLLERRKQGSLCVKPQLTMSERFQRTIKKYRAPNLDVPPAEINEATDKISVQKFIENFVPENSDSTKKETNINPIVTVKTLRHHIKKPPAIKMSKFVAKPANTFSSVRLAMPVRYKPTASEPHKITVKLVQKPITLPVSYDSNERLQDNNMDYDNYQEESYVDYEEEIEHNQEKNEIVPDVAQEVLLEEYSEEPKVAQIPHKIIIPKMAQGYDKISIAHLLPEAPFFKIVKVNEVLEQQTKKEKEVNEEEEEDVKLPIGTKLVNVNPLAHLLGDTPVEKLIGDKNTRYKPKTNKTNNFEKAIAKALLKLESYGLPKRKSKKKTEKSVEVEQ